MHVEVRLAQPEDVPAIAAVLSEATAYKAAHGDYLWGDQPFPVEEVEAKRETGGLYAVVCDGVLAGTVTLTETDERVWEEDGKDTADALYIHGLATSNNVRGQKVEGKSVGEQVIDWVVNKAQKEGRKAVRLDCSYTNRGLCQYYEQRGFTEIRRRDIPRRSNARDLRDPIYKVALMERSLPETIKR